MCVNPGGMIADKALKAAEAQWDLVAAINAEARVHSGVVSGARALLVQRGDLLALDIFDSVTQRQPDLEKKELPSLESLYGSDPDFTGGLTSEEYLHRLRGGEKALEAE